MLLLGKENTVENINMEQLPIISQKDKKELSNLKQQIEKGIENLSSYLQDIINSLLKIKRKKLYLYDKCQHMNEFVRKNNYHKKLNASINTVLTQVRTFDYAKRKRLSANQIKEIGYTKLDILQANKIETKKEIIEYGKLTTLKMKKVLNIQDKATGRFTKKGEKFERRPNTKLKNWMMEIPNEVLKQFEADFIKLCNKYEVRLP